MNVIFERLIVTLIILLAPLILCTGAFLSIQRWDSHWMNRAGAALVAAEGILGVLHFYRTKRLKIAEEELMDSTQGVENITENAAINRGNMVRKEIDKAEFSLVALTFVFIVMGEVFHGFGDLILESVLGKIH